MQPWVVGKGGYTRTQTQKYTFAFMQQLIAIFISKPRRQSYSSCNMHVRWIGNMLQDALHHHVL